MTPNKLTCIIDDDTIYVSLLKKLIQLKKLCDNILVFKNGKEAIDFFKDSESLPDLILLDLNMPIMNGWEFLEAFNPINKQLGNITTPNLYVVSSSIDPVDSEKAKKIECVRDYISKPISIQNFEQIFSVA